LESKKKFSIFNHQFLINSKVFNAQNVIIVLFIIFWLFTIRQAVLGQLGGTFKQHTIPQEYVELEKFLSSQSNFSRTFWIPSLQKFGYYSSLHPAVNGENFFHVASISRVLDLLGKQETENKLQEASIKYVIVPYDSEGELFVTGRKYDNKMYKDTIASAFSIPWLTRINGFGKIAVFQVPSPKEHFFLVPITNCGLRIAGCPKIVKITFMNPTKYEVTLQNVQKGDRLVFSESYDSHWELTSQKIPSEKYHGLLNSFVLSNSGSYTVTVEFTLQKWVNLGLVVSMISIVVIFFVIGFMKVWGQIA
jgi:hypothetical protein